MKNVVTRGFYTSNCELNEISLQHLYFFQDNECVLIEYV